MKKGTLRRLDALASDGVERATVGGPPTAFRIWRAGENTTDHGETRFTERSAALLLAEQVTRGNRYSMDINHLSLQADAPLQSQIAVGFYSLEVRSGELWAVACEWSDWVAAGLTKDPPDWKYFSPAYDVDVETGEVVSFLNCALTNNPATHHVTALATRGQSIRTRMKYDDAIAAAFGDDEEKKKEALAAIKAAFGEEEAPESKKEPKKDADEEEAPKSKKDPEEEEAPESKKDAKASVVASQDAALAKALARIAALEAKDEATERASVMASREMTKALAASLAKLPLATVKEICATLPPKAKKDLAADAKVTATRGDTQGGTAAQPASEKESMDQRMGLKPRVASIKHEGRSSTFEVMTCEDARRHLGSKKAGAK